MLSSDCNKMYELIFFISTFVLAAVIGGFIIPVLRKMKFGQTERDDGPQSHLKKQGTPTMGGIIFLIPIAFASIAAYFYPGMKNILPIMFVVIGFGFVGFIDDWLKVVKKHKNGLKPLQKMALLFAVSLLFCLYIKFVMGIDNVIYFSLLGLDVSLDISFLFIPFTMFVLLATTNGSNLTDGVDGLLGGITFIIMFFFMFINSSEEIRNAVPGVFAGDITMFSVICAGSLLGFLLYNFHPAKIFMGDTGSLALGGAVSACAIMMQRPIIILIIGIIYVAELLSVIIQVRYYKKTKKRIFRMAPLHHHYELGGWSEKKVVRIFWVVTAAACAITYISLTVKIFK